MTPTPPPRGAHLTPTGAQFTVFSSVATQIWLCLADRDDPIAMTSTGTDDWTVHVDGVRAGQRYGFRVQGPHAPTGQHSCNVNKRLLDPYARAIAGHVDWHPSTRVGNSRDSGPHVPWSVVCAAPEPVPHHHPRHHARDLVVYEAHVRGLTQLHPLVPPADRGTYRGLAHPAVIEHLTRLGVTAIELLPVHAHGHEEHLLASGRTNYWGYSTLGFFAPHPSYTASSRPEDAPSEFRAMVTALHTAGIEVWLDVVYNHTGEGGPNGPSLCFRGFDNAAYYRHIGPHYEDVTGCGNTLDVRSPVVQDLVLDSMRYWARDMGVDGFRFDLASTLARESGGIRFHADLFARMRRDPDLAHTRLIAEPWDLGRDGYGVGKFPDDWSEWNGEYRDAVRRLWSGAEDARNVVPHLLGSPHTFAPHRHTTASVNFITCHDGFTLRDLVSYARKHNEANGEDNRDGSDNNHSQNLGVEGPTDDPHINALRARLQRTFLATLAASRGVPMLLAGDELGRTQRGNNNAYCQDNALSYVDWSTADPELLAFTQRCFALRRQHLALHTDSWPTQDDGALFDPNGRPLARHETAPALQIHLKTEHSSVLLVLNAREGAVQIQLAPGTWNLALDSAEPAALVQHATSHLQRARSLSLWTQAPHGQYTLKPT